MVQEAVHIERKENRLKSPTKIGLNSPFGLGPRSRSSKKEKKNYLSGGPRSRSYKKKRKKKNIGLKTYLSDGPKRIKKKRKEKKST